MKWAEKSRVQKMTQEIAKGAVPAPESEGMTEK